MRACLCGLWGGPCLLNRIAFKNPYDYSSSSLAQITEGEKGSFGRERKHAQPQPDEADDARRADQDQDRGRSDSDLSPQLPGGHLRETLLKSLQIYLSRHTKMSQTFFNSICPRTPQTYNSKRILEIRTRMGRLRMTMTPVVGMIRPWKTQKATHLVDGIRLLRRQLRRLSPDVEFCGKFLRIPYY